MQSKVARKEREFWRSLYNEGVSDVEISSICGRHKETIYQWRRREGLPGIGRSGRKRKGAPVVMDWHKRTLDYVVKMVDVLDVPIVCKRLEEVAPMVACRITVSEVQEYLDSVI